LVKKLEILGIGRPSTYASIINTLLDRGYTNRVDQALVPTLTGFSVIQFLEKNFPEYVDYEFTSLMEDTLDEISTGEKQSTQYLSDFYFGNDDDIGLEKKVEKGADIDANESQRIRMPGLDEKYEIRVGRYGAFIIINHTDSEEKENFSIPEDCQPSELREPYILELAEIKRRGPQSIGKHPDTDEVIYCLTGRFGPYVQQGEITEEIPKPKRASIPRHIKPHDITLEIALKL
jgi:DNA topoisomerase-1